VVGARPALPCRSPKGDDATSVGSSVAGRATVDYYTWLEAMAPERQRWAERCKSAATEPQLEYARRRVRRLGEEYERGGCESRGVAVKCGCPRWRGVRWYACRQHLVCARCRIARSKRLTAKIATSIGRRFAESPRGTLIVMMTVSVAHSGDVAEDRRELALSWERFRKSFHERWGAFAFVGTFEVTPGRDGLGHVHAHMLCLWPRGKPGSGTAGDWRLERELWLQASPTSRRVDFSASNSPREAAGYVAKYVAKGVSSAEFDTVLAAKVCAGMYGKRWLLSSRRFFVSYSPVCSCCGLRVHRAVWFPRRDVTPEQRYEHGYTWFAWKDWMT
jgi:hypothetical protein